MEEEVVESWFIDDPDMEIQVKTLNSKSDTSANYATTSANIINTLLQVQTMQYSKPSIDDVEVLHREPIFFVKELALHLFLSRVFPTPQRLSYTTAAIL